MAKLDPMTSNTPSLESILTCPKCAHVQKEVMPTDFCQARYQCPGCGEVLKPADGDCCVYCTYGTVPCPPVQEHGRLCCQETS